MKRVVLYAAVVLALGAGAACGGSGDSDQAAPSTTASATTAPEATTATTTTDSSSLTHEEFVAQLDALCREGDGVIGPYEERLDALADTDYEGAADLLDERLADERVGDLQKSIQELDAPLEDRRAFDRYLALSRQLETLVPRFIDALRERDDEEIVRLGVIADDLRNERTKAAAELGSTECGA